MLALLPLLLACATEDGTAIDTGANAADAGVIRFAPHSDDGRTVAEVDPNRYVGTWYEIATSGSFQQQQCTGTTATYTPIDEDTVEVLNRCNVGTLDGPLNEIVGSATAIDPTFSRLLVDFGFGFEAPYDIVELDGSESDAPYAFAAVSSFDGAQIWILARDPDIDPELYDAIYERLEDRDFEPERLVLTDHRL